jgi:hypothetical protein
VLPVAHGRSNEKRIQQLSQLRAAIMGYGGRYLDPVE